jgi:hypothetical protein
MNDREKRSALLDKIEALLAKTEGNGCTEAEALSAAELAQSLMDKYGLSLSEIGHVSSAIDACDISMTPAGHRRAHEVLHLASAIARYTDTRYWYNRHGQTKYMGKIRNSEHKGVILVYFGLVADVQVAGYLTKTLRIMLDTEWKRYWASVDDFDKCLLPASSKVRTSFMQGIRDRISKRLNVMKQAQQKAHVNNCRAIVLAKGKILAQAWDEAQVKVRNVRPPLSCLVDLDAYNAGLEAGDRVTIAKGALEQL